MKKLWAKAKYHISITVILLGGAVTAVLYSKKDSGKKPETSVVVNGDTVLHTPGDSIKLDTAKH